ncbi:hypothetical protein GR28A_00001 [Vibrio phage vB_VcorM_GR28A]|nr:hypothetical protein GR28A_00001 [Vibrio phage vB_VcorM_GR28A]
MLEWSLENYYEWLHECQRHGLTYTEFHTMMPWQVSTYVNFKIMKRDEELDMRKKAQEQEAMQNRLVAK